MPDTSKILNIDFPMGGIDRANEFQEQPAGTTPEAVNVRSINPDTLRERGGSRAALIRYIPGPLFEGADLIQHLNVIVDPTGPLLGQSFEVPDLDWVEDPFYPGFFYPPGGWGWQPNPNATPNQQESGLHFVQSKTLSSDGTGEGANVWGADLDSAPAVGDILFLFMNGATVDPTGSPSDLSYTVTNLTGSSWTQLGVDQDYNGPDGGGTTTYNRMACWYHVVTNSTNDRRIKITATADNFGNLFSAVLQYTGQKVTGPIDDFVLNGNSETGDLDPVSTGNITITDQDELVLAFFPLTTASNSTPSGTVRVDVSLSKVIEIGPLSNPADDPTDVTAGTNGFAGYWGSVGISIKPEPES